MPIGPGKYDAVCTTARLATNAKAAIVIVLEGDKGNGFSVQSEGPLNPLVIAMALETVAREIRDSMKG